MATKRIAYDDDDIEEADVIDVKSDDISALQNDLDSEMDSVLSEFGSDDNDVNIELKIYRAIPNSAKREYLFAAVPADLPILGKLRDVYGAGTYEIRVIRNGKLYRRLTESIGAPLNPYAAVQKQDNSNDMQAFMRMIMEMQQKTDARISEIQQKSDDRLMLLMQSLSGNNQPQTSMKDMVETLVALKSLEPPRPKEKDIFEQLTGVLTVAEKLGGGSGGEENMAGVLKSAIQEMWPTIANSIDKMNNAPQTPQPSAPAQIPRQSAPPIRPNPIPKKEDNPAMLQQMKLFRFVEELCDAAERNSDPSLWADNILDRFDETVISGIATENDLVAKLCKNLPHLRARIEGHRSWFLEVQQEVRTAYLEAIGDADTESEEIMDDTSPLTNETEPTIPMDDSLEDSDIGHEVST